METDKTNATTKKTETNTHDQTKQDETKQHKTENQNK